MKVLQLCFRVPFPPHDGGAIAMYDIMYGLSKKGHEVHVLAVNTPKHFQKDDVLKDIAKVKTVFIDTTISPVDAFLNLFKSIPYNLERFVSKDFENALIELLQNNSFDIIHVEGTFVAYYIDVIRTYSKAPVVLRAHNVEYLIWQRLARNEKNPLKKIYLNLLSSKLKSFEKKYFSKYDVIAGITQEDNQRLNELGVNTPKEFIPAGVQLNRFLIDPTIKPKPNSMFIISSLNWLPNLEGLEWFIKKVWPEAKRKNPLLELHIAGKDTPESVQQLAGNGIFVHGYVADASVFMQQYDLMLVPLLSGGGMRLKIIEGMALGKCILTSNIGAEGIACESNKDILKFDEAEEWIAILLDYFANTNKYASIGPNARQVIMEQYDNDKVVDRLVTLYKRLLNRS
ncbi:MAG: glycosyltransferase [Chitinophagaceae bacterium]|nr:glycosyltransferase [Chitinophagaceae bacterium]